MESNLQIQNFKQMVTNLLTEMLRALENPEMTNTNERDTRRPMERFFPSQNLGAYWIQMASMAEFREAQTALHGQAIQMEENGIETEALVFLLLKLTQLAEAVREARDRWLTYRDFSSVGLVQFLLSWTIRGALTSSGFSMGYPEWLDWMTKSKPTILLY